VDARRLLAFGLPVTGTSRRAQFVATLRAAGREASGGKDPMTPKPKPALRGRQLASSLLRLLRIYWRSPDAPRGALLLAGAILLEFGTVEASLLVSGAQRSVIDGLEARDPSGFSVALGAFAALALLGVLVSTWRIYLRQQLEIRWRRGLTCDVLGRWMGPGAFADHQLHAASIDNPDQRVAEDVRDFVASALGLSLSLLAAAATLVAFGGLLWRLSHGWSLPIAGRVEIPGLLLWVAVLFAIGSMVAAHVAGRRLVPINNDRLRAEADFRYGLMRFRDNVEPIALSGGERTLRAGAETRFGRVAAAFVRTIRAERDLNFLTGSLGQLSALTPFLVAAPAYFAGALTLGMIVQARIAYDQVSGALLWFVNAYREIARWRANTERVEAFLGALEQTERALAADALAPAASPRGEIALEDLELPMPAGGALVARGRWAIPAGAHAAILGAAGSGKTVLFRALAGIWPFGAGRIWRPSGEALFLPQEPYFPIGTLREVLSFPACEGDIPDARLVAALERVGLGRLREDLGESAVWEQRLSAQERQTLSFARALAHAPKWVLLDQAASSLDEELERSLHERLVEDLPGTTVVALGPRPRTLELLDLRWTLAPQPGGGVVLQSA
jgi:putative ATP-binding cassette transporter